MFKIGDRVKTTALCKYYELFPEGTEGVIIDILSDFLPYPIIINFDHPDGECSPVTAEEIERLV